MPQPASHIDTIAAIATPRGVGGIGIIRVSGPAALASVQQFFRPSNATRYEPKHSHVLTHGHILDNDDRTVLDEVLVAYFRAPRTYTGEEMVEISAHGGDVVLRAVMARLDLTGTRLANPGEFTQRAFLNGRIDLAQAEAVADVIHAKTESSLRAATAQLTGVLSASVHEIRDNLVRLLAEVEAAIDFPDEDLDLASIRDQSARAIDLHANVANLVAAAKRGSHLRDGFDVVLVGKPNVGKSSLLNALLKSDRAIVTDIPGTTRDVIEDYVDMRGVPVRIADTAGIREATDAVEREGVARSHRRVKTADLLLVVLDTSRPLDHEDLDLLAKTADHPRMFLLNKSDLPTAWQRTGVPNHLPKDVPAFHVSAKTGAGLDSLTQAIAATAMGGQARDEGFDVELPLVTNLRHAAALRDAERALGSACASLEDAVSPELTALDLRGALDALGLIVGDTATEDILDEIFSRFCIGK